MFEILRAKTRERKWLCVCVCVERESKRAKGIDKWKKSVNKELEHTLMKVRPTKKWINRGLYKINTKIKLDRYNKHKILKRERERERERETWLWASAKMQAWKNSKWGK